MKKEIVYIFQINHGKYFVKIVKYGSVYRLRTKNSLYITANKEYVEKV
ncbi:DUF5776 domain-containing protein [Rummeliibacillus pycnus]